MGYGLNFDQLAFIWAGVIALAVLIYILLDGFDLGVGALFPFLKSTHAREEAMNSVAPFWDGNETWLVMGGGGLLAVFPLAYSILLPALYAPIIFMLLSLVFRGVAFEFRDRSDHPERWDLAFCGGSIGAAFAQGVSLGVLVQGIRVENRAYAGGWWDWLTPFSLLTGFALLTGYALLGACWLIYKSETDLKNSGLKYARILAPILVVAIVIVSLWTLKINNGVYFDRWIGWPQILYAAIVPVLIVACSVWLFRSLGRSAVHCTHDHAPLLASKGLFIISYVGLGISFYPYIVPTSVTIWEAAAPLQSLAFLFTGAVFLVPLVILNFVYAYWVFRGKFKTVH